MAHVKLHVYDDGDVEVSSHLNKPSMITEGVWFDSKEITSIIEELMDYGCESNDSIKAVHYTINNVPSDCIVGKL